jgi:hypothetical protein
MLIESCLAVKAAVRPGQEAWYPAVIRPVTVAPEAPVAFSLVAAAASTACTLSVLTESIL